MAAKRLRSTGTRRAVRRRVSSSSRSSSRRRSTSSGGGSSRSFGNGDWSSDGDAAFGAISFPVFVILVIVLGVIFCVNAIGSDSSDSSPSSRRRPTATPVVSETVRAEVVGQWTVTIETTRPAEVNGHERRADCRAAADCTFDEDTCALEEDPDTCETRTIPGTCEDVITGYRTEDTNCRWEETGVGYWEDVDCRPDPADRDYEICDQEYVVEEEYVCDEERVPVITRRCDEEQVCQTTEFCDTVRVVQVPDETYTASGFGPEVIPPAVAVPAGGTSTETVSFEVTLFGADYEASLDPTPQDLDTYLAILQPAYYILVDQNGEPFFHVTAGVLESGNYPTPRP